MAKDSVPDCGLYRAGVSLVNNEEKVPAGSLVSFHNHSDRGIPMVQTPHNNENNLWTFHSHGFGVEDPYNGLPLTKNSKSRCAASVSFWANPFLFFCFSKL